MDIIKKRLTEEISLKMIKLNGFMIFKMKRKI